MRTIVIFQVKISFFGIVKYEEDICLIKNNNVHILHVNNTLPQKMFLKSRSFVEKMQSIEILKSQNIPFIQHLPEIEDLNFSISRCAKKIAYRAMAVSMVAVKAQGLEHEILRKIIENYKLDDHFSMI